MKPVQKLEFTLERLGQKEPFVYITTNHSCRIVIHEVHLSAIGLDAGVCPRVILNTNDQPAETIFLSPDISIAYMGKTRVEMKAVEGCITVVIYGGSIVK